MNNAEELRMLVKLEDRSRDYVDKAMLSAAAELDRLQEVLTFPIITPEASSSALFIRVLSEHEKGRPVNGQDLINALMWRVRNQRQEIARLQAKRATPETGCCLWQREYPDNEFFFTTGCGQEGVNRETSYLFCPYCSKKLTTREPTALKAFVQLCAPHGKDWLTCPECAKAAGIGEAQS